MCLEALNSFYQSARKLSLYDVQLVHFADKNCYRKIFLEVAIQSPHATLRIHAQYHIFLKSHNQARSISFFQRRVKELSIYLVGDEERNTIGRKTALGVASWMTSSTMVTRTSQHLGASENMRSESAKDNQGRDTQVAGTPRHSRKETSTPKPSQDAELKDYVGSPEFESDGRIS